MKNNHIVSPGIGWEGDLKVALHQSTQNRWFPQIKAGWFYLNAQEDYLYAIEGWEDVVIPEGITTNFILSSNPNLRVASGQGPIIIDGDELRYTRVTANLSVYVEATPVIYDNNLLFIDISGEVVMVTDSSGFDMSSVPSTGHLVERKYYYWDFINRRIWVARASSDPNRQSNLYITYLKDKPDLKQQELIIADSDGKFRVMFDRVAGSPWDPTIFIIGIGSVAVSNIDKNVITPAITVAEGTKAAISYYVDGSFCITDNNTDPEGVFIATFREKEEKAVFRWEQAQWFSSFDTGVFSDRELSYVQINPIMSGCESGFLYLSKPRHPAETLSTLKLDVSPIRISGKQREPTRIVASTLDSANTPLGKVDVDVWISDVQGNTYKPIPLDVDTSLGGRTDFSGKKHFIWESSPTTIGTYTVYASSMTVTGGVLMTSHPLLVVGSLLFTDVINTTKVSLYLNPSKDPDGLQDLYIYLTTQYGTPAIPNLKVSIHCETGRLFYGKTFSSSGSNVGFQDLEIPFSNTSSDGLRVTTCKYLSVAGDKIIAYPTNNTDDVNPANWALTPYSFECTPLEIEA